MTDANTLTSLSSQWQSLRGTDDNEVKSNVLKSLYQALGKEGTSAKTVLEHLGQPDDTSANMSGTSGVIPTMPGPMMTQGAGGQQAQGQPLYLVYYPQKGNKNQYLSFKVNDKTETVEKAEWHQ